MTEPVIANEGPYPVDVEAGKKYFWCSCGRSNKQPFCDGSHKGTDFQPLQFVAEDDETVYLCGCKHTGEKPYCDGAHASLG